MPTTTDYSSRTPVSMNQNRLHLLVRFNLVASAVRDGQRLIGVVLGARRQ